MINPNDYKKSDILLADLWPNLTSPIYNWLDEDGEPMGNTQVRQLGEYEWLCVDDQNGYHILTDYDMQYARLEVSQRGQEDR